MRKTGLLMGTVLLVLSALAALAGCGGAVIGGPPDIRGTITSLQESAGGGTGSILVEGQLEPDTNVDRASVTINTGTRIFIDYATGTHEAAFADLAVGARVEVIFTGPVAESYPVQATAAQVIIMR